MRISVIGAGRVAHHLAQVLSQHHEIVQVFSREQSKANLLAALVRARPCNAIEDLEDTVDIALLVVSDKAIEEVAEKVAKQFPQALIVHTSGSTHISKITQYHERAGVFYPLQTFSFESQIDWLSTPIFVEAMSDQDLASLTQMAKELSQKVYQYDSTQRLSLHLAAVFACNFTNYCYDVAKQLVDAQKVDFNLLYPLILETAKKATLNPPKQVQTGPAMRGDQNIIHMHQEMLAQAGRTDLSQVYSVVSDQIYKRQSE